MSNDIVNNILFIVLGIVGTILTAYITSRGEKPTDTFEAAIREERNQNAQKDKKIIDLGEELVLEKRKRYEILKERDVYAAHDLKLQRLLKRHAPRVDVPAVDINGNSTPPKERRKNE